MKNELEIKNCTFKPEVKRNNNKGRKSSQPSTFSSNQKRRHSTSTMALNIFQLNHNASQSSQFKFPEDLVILIRKIKV